MPSLLPHEVATAGATGRAEPTDAAFSLAVAVARRLFLVFVPLLLLVPLLSPLHVFTLLLLTLLLSFGSAVAEGSADAIKIASLAAQVLILLASSAELLFGRSC